MKRTDYFIIGAAAVALIVGYTIMERPFVSKEAPIVENGDIADIGEDAIDNIEEEADNGNITVQATDDVALSSGSNEIVMEDFSITPPANWEGRPAPTGVLALAIDPSESITDPKAAAIGFRSYFAVMKENLDGKTREEYISFIGDELDKIADLVVLEKTWQTKTDGMDASVLDISMRQQDINFKVLIFFIWDGEDIWSISFNTTADKWESYEDMFFTVGNSFRKTN